MNSGPTVNSILNSSTFNSTLYSIQQIRVDYQTADITHVYNIIQLIL